VTEALKGVSLEIREGELFGLLGPNGAGKTTLASILSGLLKPDSGDAYILGHHVEGESNHIKLLVGVVSGGQDRQLYHQLTAEENLEFFGHLYGLSGQKLKDRINELLKIVGLEGQKDNLVRRFSLGMRQKLAIAKALIHDPPVLILDEPTIGLDPNAALSVRTFIKETLSREQGKTILLTTHYMYEADYLCDRIAIIDKGQIIAKGTPDELKKRVQDDTIIEMMVVGNITHEIESVLRSTELIHGVTLEVKNGGNQATIRAVSKNGEETIPEIIDLIVRRLGLKVYGVNLQTPTLEDVFIKLTGKGLKNGGGNHNAL